MWASSGGENAVMGCLDPQSDAAHHDMKSRSEFRKDFSVFGEEKPRKGPDQGTGAAISYQGIGADSKT